VPVGDGTIDLNAHALPLGEYQWVMCSRTLAMM
jgi:hypothetical protein